MFKRKKKRIQVVKKYSVDQMADFMEDMSYCKAHQRKDIRCAEESCKGCIVEYLQEVIEA